MGIFASENLIYDEIFFFVRKRNFTQFIAYSCIFSALSAVLFLFMAFLGDADMNATFFIAFSAIGLIVYLSDLVNSIFTIHKRFSIIITEKEITIACEPFFMQREICVYQLDRVLKINFYPDAPELIFVDRSEFDNWITANLPKQFFTYLHEHRNISIS